jgi:hypothetical protein
VLTAPGDGFFVFSSRTASDRFLFHPPRRGTDAVNSGAPISSGADEETMSKRLYVGNLSYNTNEAKPRTERSGGGGGGYGGGGGSRGGYGGGGGRW